MTLLNRIQRMERHHWETVIILKVVVSVGLAAAYFLPPGAAISVGMGANLLWIWKV